MEVDGRARPTPSLFQGHRSVEHGRVALVLLGVWLSKQAAMVSVAAAVGSHAWRLPRADCEPMHAPLLASFLPFLPFFGAICSVRYAT
ncbi:hypothetical protein BC831DRAFT_443949 [Entophlyctis helioformis]|nr:hypothetical protein BC831DRAFT_443949 [Entophlyctis helioformis]